MSPVTLNERVAILETLMKVVGEDVTEVKADVKTLLSAGLIADARRMSLGQIARLHVSIITVGFTVAVALHSFGVF